MYNRHSSCLFIILLIIFHVSQAPTLALKVSFCWNFRVHIINNLSHDNLDIHCHSCEDDLGQHMLGKNDDFTFKFGQHIVFVTHFWCEMKYGDYHSKAITVYTDDFGDKYCCLTKKCFWSVRDDAFYFSNNNRSWVKWYDWS